MENGALRLAVKDWRARFRAEGRNIIVDAIMTGYRPRELATSQDPSLLVHRDFVVRFASTIQVAD